MANPFVHVELHTHDLPKARQFYQSLFGWELQDMPMPGGGGSYTMIGVGEGIGGGMMADAGAAAALARLRRRRRCPRQDGAGKNRLAPPCCRTSWRSATSAR